MVKKNDNKQPVRRKRRTDNDISTKKRWPHKIYFSDDEWAQVVAKADWVKREPSVYGREVMLGYKPVVPDPEFRHGLMRCRDDIKKLFDFLRGLRLTTEERYNLIVQLDFLEKWTKGVTNILDFLDCWIKRV